MTAVALFFFSTLIHVGVSHHVRSSHVIGDPGLSDVIFTDDLLFDVNVRSPFECAKKCSNTEACASRSLTYHKASMTSSRGHKNVVTSCRCHKNVMTSNSSSVPAIGTKAFVIREEPAGYKMDLASGLCWKMYDVIADYATARNTCQTEGAFLVTLDTETKLRPFYNNLLKDTPVAEYYVGATRPVDQWNTSWTGGTDYFAWTRTGESMQPVSHHFAPSYPKFRSDFNCVALLFIHKWTKLGAFGVLKDGNCQTGRRFVCEKACKH